MACVNDQQEARSICDDALSSMMVYSPQTAVIISGTAPVFSGVVDKTIKVGNSGTIHYDTRLNAIWPDIWSLIFSPSL
jgi:hypothetical protein